MKKSENFFALEKRLFEEIQKNLPSQYVLVDVISEVLEIGIDSAYRRIRCTKLLNFKEVCALCQHFSISIDMLMGVKDNHQFDCIYRPINLSAPNEYQNYILAFSSIFRKMRASGDLSILMSATDIPVFHLISHKELTFFKLYTWDHSVYNYKGYFEDFIKKFETPEIINYFQKINLDYELTSSAEIWTDSSIDTTLKLIGYYFEIGMFASKDLSLLLCEQILNILDKLQKWTENSSKSNCITPFQLYVSEIELENTYCLMKQSGIINCIVKLFTINHLHVLDKEFCLEAENWLTKLSKRSALLCGNSEKERIKFFHLQRQKVRFLMDKIQGSF